MISLPDEASVALLATHDIGRIAVHHDGYPIALPVNYRLVELDGAPVVAIRTRGGNSLDHVDEAVGFEIDGVDAGHDAGWSVLVRGHLRAVAPSAAIDSDPMIAAERNAWRLIVPTSISGRRGPCRPAALDVPSGRVPVAPIRPGPDADGRVTGMSHGYPLDVGGVDDYPIKVGSMLLTMVDPTGASSTRTTAGTSATTSTPAA